MKWAVFWVVFEGLLRFVMVRNDGVKLCFKLFSRPIMEGAKCRNFCDFLLQILIFLAKFFRAKKGAKGHFARKISKQSLIKK